jgi:hypothetical protein
MLIRLLNRLRAPTVNACFCTLAIHSPYRQRARRLLADAASVNWIVLTDEPDDFADLPVLAIRHQPTGPMAIDFLTRLPPRGNGRGQPAYHDKRFVLDVALKEFDTAIFVDADTRIRSLPRLPSFRHGIAVVKEVQATISEHLSRYGSDRLPAFEELALHLTGSVENVKTARWCSEALFAVTKDGNESKFMEAWARGAEFCRAKVCSQEKAGVIGLAAMCAGWTVDYSKLDKLASRTHHEGKWTKIRVSHTQQPHATVDYPIIVHPAEHHSPL